MVKRCCMSGEMKRKRMSIYLLALQKGSLLKEELLRHKQRTEQEERDRLAAEAARARKSA